jgi:HK97 family phage prohead protease
MKNKKMIPMGSIRSTISNEVVDEDRTVELTFSTGSKGLRNGWDGPYYEELSMDPKHLDMSRLQSGAPLLASHNSQDLNAVIGVVERAWLVGDEGKAIVRFSKDPEADKVYQKVKEKVLRNISIGYQVRKYEDVTNKGDKYPTYRATDYSIHEISVVPIGFDDRAKVRENELLNEVEIEQKEELKQETEPIIKEEQRMTEAEKLALENAAKKQAILDEKTRQLEIRQAVKMAKLDETVAEELISNDTSINEARKLVLEKMASSQPKPVDTSVKIEVSSVNEDKRREIFETSILARIDGNNFKNDENSKAIYGQNLLRQIESFIPRHSMESDSAYAKRTMASSDLPKALANIAEKSLQKQYDLQPKTFQQWSRQDTLRNYKEFSQVKSGDFSSLVERPENAEFEIGSFGEANETVQLKDYGKIHAFSSQMLVNDDLGVLARLSSSGGIAAARLENRLAYQALVTNKVMKDGVALYHATHKNLGTAGAITSTSIAEAYKLLRKQTSTDGLDVLNLSPKYFVCGPDQEAMARQFFAPINAQQTSNVNIYSGSMQVIVDAELTGNQYYILGDQNVCDTIVCYRLQGNEQPVISSRVDFNTNSLQLKIEHSFAAAPMDFRNIVKNAGQ